MGYTTDFTGHFTITPALEPKHCEYLKAFNDTRRMKRDAALAAALPDPVRAAAGLPVGVDGGYYVGSQVPSGQDFSSPSIVDRNASPVGQPGLWCQWVPTEDGSQLKWDGGEKFYAYVEWLEYLIEHFLKPWGYSLSGEVLWHGEDSHDLGKISISQNEVVVYEGRVIYE